MWIKLNNQYVNTSTIQSIFTVEVNFGWAIAIQFSDRILYSEKRHKTENEATNVIREVVKFLDKVDHIPNVSF